jgi:hypothetical protein
LNARSSQRRHALVGESWSKHINRGQNLTGRYRTGSLINKAPTPVQPVVQQPVVDPFNRYRDSQYWQDYAQQFAALRGQTRPFEAQIKGLQSQLNGKTLYDRLYEQAQNDLNTKLRESRFSASKRGLLRSGAQELASAGLGTAFSNQATDLSNQYGAGKINELQQNITDAKTGFQDALAQLSLAAINRAGEGRSKLSQELIDKIITGLTQGVASGS